MYVGAYLNILKPETNFLVSGERLLDNVHYTKYYMHDKLSNVTYKNQPQVVLIVGVRLLFIY